MLGQENRPDTEAVNAATSNMTQLEGIRQKVFMDRYSLKDASGSPLEFYPEQLWARVARGIASVEQSEEKREEWEKKFYEALTNFQFVPGGRILAGAGTGHQVTYYNCMPPDQEVLTASGYQPISQLSIGDLVVTHRNRLRPVLHKFERETEETLYIIRPKKIGYDDLRVTGDHKVYLVRSEWVNKHRSRDGLRLKQEPEWIPAKEIKPGDYVAIAHNDEEAYTEAIHLHDYTSGYETQDGKLFKATTRGEHGYVSDWGTHYKVQNELTLDSELCYLFGRWLGDGCITHRTGTNIPSGIKLVFSLEEQQEAEEIARIVEAKFGIEASIKLSSTERWYDLWVNSMPLGEFFKAFLGCYSHSKQIPDQLMHLPDELSLELLRGLFSADGYVSDNKLGIVLANRTLVVQIHQLLLRMGYLFSIRENTHRLSRTPAYRIQATANECAPLFQQFFGVQAPEHNIDLKYYFEYNDLKWVRVDEIAVEDYSGTVLDIEVEEDHSFISAGVVVSNCFVIPSPEDSRQGILDNLKIMTEIMARGGGVGINLSTLRPRGSYIKTVNGTASGPCSWAQLYSVATGDVIQQGGCFGPNERIATDKGLIPAQELADRLDKGEAIQAQTHKGFRPFTYVFRNGIKDLYEVTSGRGNSVRITLDHKMGVMRGGEIVTVPLRELLEGDEVLLLVEESKQVSQSGSVAVLERVATQPTVLTDVIVSIQLVGPSEVYDFEVEDVHMLSSNGFYTSNSRRGALMLMLDDTHPDVEEFITVKKTAGKIEHANLSVCISDAFMQAVKDDADWNLIWQDEVKKTIRARHLWDLICTSAWESAEPGVVFMDRYNKESNTWYYENIRCVNPCVTGDTLVSTEHGYTYARDLQLGMKVRTPAGLKPIEKLYNNGLQRIYRVNFSDGGYLKGTADHKLKVVRDKKYQWVPISELTEGDKVLVVPNETFGPRQNLPKEATEYIAKRELGFANFYDRKLGLCVGAVLGDGTLREVTNGNSHSYQCKVAFGTHEDSWYDTFTGLMTDMNIHTHRTLAEKDFVGYGGVAVKHASIRLECYKLASLLVRVGMTPNVKGPQKVIPTAFLSMEKEFLAGILDGLFSTDGSVLMKQDNPMLRFHTSSYELAQQVRLILLQFGIHGRIYRASRAEDLEYDGRSMYGTGEKYDLLIINEGIARFYAEIGLSHPDKAARLKDIAENWHYIGGTWMASVVTIEDTKSEEEVYDLYEPETLTWITNGYCSLDCGEQGLPSWGVCNLGAINLSAFVENRAMDWERLATISKTAMRFLDNVVDANEYFIPENREAQLSTRRTGLGTMGLADALIKMGVAYGSEESLPIIERIYSTIRDASYEASADIAVEKGVFPQFEREKYMQGKFIKRLPRALQDKIRKQGIRNAVLLTQAPTGTTSLLSGVSSGIEPVYDFAMIRRDRTGEHIMYHPLLQEWRDEHTDEETPGYFVSSKDLSPEEHVRVQAMVQRYTDSSISKCVVGDTLVSSERGLLPIVDLYVGEQPDTFRSLALHVASLKGTQLTSHFYFGGIKPTQRVKLADGHEITGTPNHQLYVGTSEGLLWKRLDELVPGDYVALKIGAQLFGIDVPLHGFRQSTVRSGYQKTISIPAFMNPVLAHFIGSYMAEGCIVHYTVRITNNDESVLERLREDSRLLFGLDGNITPQGKNNALTLQINSKSLCELLRFLGCEGKAAQKTIPWSILQSSRESMVAFLSGLYLDGFITDTKVAICLASQKLIQQLQIVFDNFGVQTWITVKHNAQYNRDYYELNAHEQEAQRILHLLTFDETHKRERALKLLQREFQNNKSDIIPIEAQKSVFAEASRTVRYRHHSYSQALKQDGREKMLSWFGLRQLANDPEVQLAPSLQEIWQESLHFRPVIAVENSGEQPVYDLSVPSTTAFVGNGIVNHNTVNAPNEHTVDQVQKLYRLAYEMGCKGVTYYRDGSRDAVLTRVEDEKKKSAEAKPAEQGQQVQQSQAAPQGAASTTQAAFVSPASNGATASHSTGSAMIPSESIEHGIKQRPAVMQGYTRQVRAPEGKINVTINSDEQGPFEVFVNVGKAGSDIAALSEALGRLISLNLQVLSPLSPVDRAQEIAKQLRGIGGSRSVGFGVQQVRSLPDAVARALEIHMESLLTAQRESATTTPNEASAPSSVAQHLDGSQHLNLETTQLTGNLCPECGCNTMVYEEGCRKCYSCGHSEC